MMGVYINIDVKEIKRGAIAILNIDDVAFFVTDTAGGIIAVPDHGDLMKSSMTATSNTMASDTVKIPIMDGTTKIDPVKHGKWIDHIKDYWCSECGGRIQKDQAKMFSICPYCGVKMDRGEE